MVASSTFIPNLAVGAEWERSHEAQEAVNHVGESVAEVARTLAPVDTGALRDSISSHEGEGAGAIAQIIAEVPYAAFVEFGTSEMDAQPFLRPALDAAVSGV